MESSGNTSSYICRCILTSQLARCNNYIPHTNAAGTHAMRCNALLHANDYAMYVVPRFTKALPLEEGVTSTTHVDGWYGVL